jgi:four helix bundle protein
VNYKRFEDLPCWQKARELCQEVFKLINQGKYQRDFSLKDQIWRASGSIMDNIAEGFEDGSPREFLKFLGYSQRSCSEVQSHLYRSLDVNYITQDRFDRIYNLVWECRKQIKGFRKYLRTYNLKDN